MAPGPAAGPAAQTLEKRKSARNTHGQHIHDPRKAPRRRRAGVPAGPQGSLLASQLVPDQQVHVAAPCRARRRGFPHLNHLWESRCADDGAGTLWGVGVLSMRGQ